VIDLVPTIREIAGAPRLEAGAASAPPGRSLVPAFAHDGTVSHDELWWEHEGNRAIRLGDWKLVASRDEPWELYDLATDRTETQNLARQYPEKVRELARRWQQRHDELVAIAVRP
jgi:arylsulfatase